MYGETNLLQVHVEESHTNLLVLHFANPFVSS